MESLVPLAQPFVYIYIYTVCMYIYISIYIIYQMDGDVPCEKNKKHLNRWCLQYKLIDSSGPT